MRGRKPKPVEERVVEGNAGKRPLPEPVIVGGRATTMEPPSDLPNDAKKVWLKIVPVLTEIGIIDVVDEMALEAMCVQWARAKQAGRAIAKHGIVTKGSQGQLRESPLVATERNAHAMFLRFAEQYALTPSARTRLGMAELQRRSLSKDLAEDGDLELSPADEDPIEAEVVEA